MNNSAVNIPQHLIPQKDITIYLAISGGVDSMVLLYILLKLPNPVHLLHVNYHLRGDESNADENLIRKQAKKYDVEVSVLDFDMKKHLIENGGNLQNEARKVRYAFFLKHLEENSVLMTAQHLDDQMETFFMHLSRKSGVAGMSCMAERNGSHIRPLLNFRKSELYSFAKENDVDFREDVSNQENKYLRNQWRNVWIPEMEARVLNLAESVRIFIEALQNERTRLEEKYESELNEIVQSGNWAFGKYDKMCTEGKHLVARNFEFRPSELDELTKLRHAGKSKKLEIKRGNLTIWNSGDSFVFDWKDEEGFSPEITIEKVTRLPMEFDKNAVYLDKDKLSGELRIRRWEAGDRIASIGMNGSQLISDVIKDAKVEAHLKSNILVVTDDDKIVWVVGLKVGRISVASENSKTILKVTV